LAAKAAGVKFVIMKATEGIVGQDRIYKEHKERLAGILPRGHYHYLRTQSSPQAQAKYYYDFAGRVELPPSLDVEDYYKELPKGQELFDLINEALTSIDTLFGQECMLYTSPNIIQNYLGLSLAQKLTNRKLWLAHYGVSTPDIRPWKTATFWQFTDKGHAANYGITEAQDVDENYYFGTEDQFKQEFKLQGETPMPEQSKAIGFELNQYNKKVDSTKLKGDFCILVGGQGSYQYSNLEGNYLAAYYANIPTILLWDIIIPTAIDASDLSKTFGPYAEDENIKAITAAMKFHGYSGVILRFLDKDFPDGRVFTQKWMSNFITYIFNGVYDQTKKLVWWMSSSDFVNGFGSAPELNQTLSTLDGMCSFKRAFPNRETEKFPWDNKPIPPADYTPEFISNCKIAYFINYCRTLCLFDGVEGAVPLWEYFAGDREQLRADINYVDHAVIIPTDPGDTPIPAKTWTVVTTRLNVRLAPRLNGTVAGILYKGTTIDDAGETPIVADGVTWRKVIVYAAEIQNGFQLMK
jgi:GH25 family lysozyme M1 (1,4-beta-N-acetylmuramidase)